MEVTVTTLEQARYASSARAEAEPTGWTGWIGFAAIMLVLAGCFQGIAGLAAIFKDEVFVVRDSGLVVSADYTTWGWVHLGIAVLLLLAGASLFSGNMYGRIVGVLVAMASAIVNLVFIAAYPVWAVLIIAVDVFVIYAIVVHGRELKAE
jgi:hypothetical protein